MKLLTMIECPPIIGAPSEGYARAAVNHSIRCLERPFCRELLYRDDLLGEGMVAERARRAGLELYRHAQSCHVFADHGVTPNMLIGIKEACKFDDVRFKVVLLSQPDERKVAILSDVADMLDRYERLCWLGASR